MTNIFGIILNESCDDDNAKTCIKSTLAQLSATKDLKGIYGLDLHSLESLETILLPGVQVLQNFLLRDIPQLTTIQSTIGLIDRMTVTNSPKLTTFTYGERQAHLNWLRLASPNFTCSLDTIGLKSLDFISELLLCNDGCTVRNIPNVQQFDLKPGDWITGPVDIQGNGNLSMTVSTRQGAWFWMPVAFSGLVNLTFAKIPIPPTASGLDPNMSNSSQPSIHMRDLTLHDWPTETIYLPFIYAHKFTIRDNRHLKKLKGSMEIVSILSILNNPLLKLDKSVGNANSSQWMWEFLLDMTINGPVTTDFL